MAETPETGSDATTTGENTMQQWNNFKLRSVGRLELAAEIIQHARSVSDDRQTIDKLADALALVRDAATAMTHEATNGNQSGHIVRTISSITDEA